MLCILITAANSAEAYRIKNNLEDSCILLGDYRDVPELMLRTGAIIKLPAPSSESYIHDLLSLCLDKQVNTVYLLRAEESLALAQAGPLFDEFDIQLNVAGNEV